VIWVITLVSCQCSKKVTYALGGADHVSEQVPAAAGVLFQAFEPGAVLVEADLMVAINGPAHGGGVLPGQDAFEVGFRDGFQSNAESGKKSGSSTCLSE
jgi:hypothetical protein